MIAASVAVASTSVPLFAAWMKISASRPSGQRPMPTVYLNLPWTTSRTSWPRRFGRRSRAIRNIQGAVARERGIAAHQAWLPLEQIRATHIAQQEWEERYA
jgi:hypothetical protein